MWLLLHCFGISRAGAGAGAGRAEEREERKQIE